MVLKNSQFLINHGVTIKKVLTRDETQSDILSNHCEDRSSESAVKLEVVSTRLDVQKHAHVKMLS